MISLFFEDDEAVFIFDENSVRICFTFFDFFSALLFQIRLGIISDGCSSSFSSFDLRKSPRVCALIILIFCFCGLTMCVKC